MAGGDMGGAHISAIQARFKRALRGVLFTTDSDWGNAVVAEYRTHPDVKFRTWTAQPDQLFEAVRLQNADLVLVDNDLAGSESGLALAERVARAFPKIGVYLASAAPSMALHNEARVRGILSVVARPFTPDELVTVIASVLAQEQEAAARLQSVPGGAAAHRGGQVVAPRLIAVAGGKGGTGKSNFATNLAVLVQTNPSARLLSALVDMERNDGAAPFLLGGMKKQPTTEDWLAYVGEHDTAVDPGTVASHLVAEHDRTGLHVVFNPDGYHDYDALDDHVVTVMLNTLRLMHAVTVVDCPPTPTLPALVAMAQATSIAIVTELDPPTLSATKRYLREIEHDGVDVGKVRVIYNRVEAHPAMSIEEANDVLADYGACATTLPADPAVPLARSHMQPIVLESPDSPWVRALRKVAADLLPGMGLEFGSSSAGGRKAPARPGAPRRRFLGLF